VALAVLMGGGLVLFGIGGGTSGGLLDGLGISGGGTSSDPQFDDRIERAQATLETSPDDEKALLSLAEAHFLRAQTELEVDEQGRQTVTEEAQSDYAAAIEAWETYLGTEPEKPDDSVAALVLRAYGYTISLDDLPSELKTEVKGAYEAANVVAQSQPSFGTYLTLTQTALLAGEDKAAKEAEKKTLAEAPDESSKTAAKSQIASAKQQAVVVQKYIEGKAPTTAEGPNPLSGLGGGLAPTDPAAGAEPPPVPEPTGGGDGKK
jgi:tetratricopeptide (TPR) repeat protein